ncbi:hypothetical protein SNE40_012074 [Patella caerulea]|uniref:Uncharacterized protein n=1 Tax=Patella caerulea TaxID=87958 RepID=A0AAN8JMT3_PATCE
MARRQINTSEVLNILMNDDSDNLVDSEDEYLPNDESDSSEEPDSPVAKSRCKISVPYIPCSESKEAPAPPAEEAPAPPAEEAPAPPAEEAPAPSAEDIPAPPAEDAPAPPAEDTPAPPAEDARAAEVYQDVANIPKRIYKKVEIKVLVTDQEPEPDQLNIPDDKKKQKKKL